jgi:uncharacterized protein YjbI with pentapeptide repeats
MSSQEVTNRYSHGERDFIGIEVPEGDSFRGVNLSGANFKNSWISIVDFRNAILRGVCFDYTNVKLSDFRHADLTGASFRGAFLCGAFFKSAKLENVEVKGATWYGGQVLDIRELENLMDPK